ncbi:MULTISPECIES: rhodanese-like domain-containing protein [Ramlibacter]|uniref:Sulfurtransferase n=1 Tax=Ramlibacter pinisoli TaxID=2682844 RepID=A0A6N8IRJ9_9BURK|nr:MULTISPECIES: rhodanese-like domain-containing protein [Ramlibacter]MBA2964501.1 sulfurtransferase [Ramlibacter sp. CGMCC 1.13660]MVQ29467.1 sulfurtransferase [Ramlibacter pinisoli]
MIDQIRPEGVDDWLAAQGGNGVVLDVREPAELRAASITPAGFELVAIPMMEIPARLQELDPDRPVACLCHHGARSMRVAMFLANNGFSKVANIAGGIDAWSIGRDPAVPRY